MKKKIGFFLLILLAIILLFTFFGVRHFNNLWFKEKANYFSVDYSSEPINFIWADKVYDDYTEEHVALLIPFKMPGFSNNFYWQFDTGAPYSMIYGNTLNSLKDVGLKINEEIIGGNRFVERLTCAFSDQEINFNTLLVKENYGGSFVIADTLSRQKVGTIGADFLLDKITLIDFKNQTIQLFDERPKWMSEAGAFESFDFTGRRFMLPCTIDNKKMELFYDSGCSAFGLITSKSRYDNYSMNSNKEIKYDGKRWGESLAMYHKDSDQKLTMGQTELELKRVSYVDMYAPFQKFMTPFTRIGGWLGNKPFLDHVMILDTKSEEFLIVESHSLID